jgi:hypothetical protein
MPPDQKSCLTMHCSIARPAISVQTTLRWRSHLIAVIANGMRIVKYSLSNSLPHIDSLQKAICGEALIIWLANLRVDSAPGSYM